MPNIVFVTADNKEISVNAELGKSVMEVALEAGLEGILGQCGGACACATCHIYVDEKDFSKLEAKSELENMMLTFALNPNKYSRLSCQIKISDKHNGLRVYIADNEL